MAPFLVSRTPLPRELVASAVPDAETITGDDVQLSAKDAVHVLKNLGYRLLTEDEWEFVARGGSTISWLADVHALIRKAFGRQPLGKKPTGSGTVRTKELK